MKRLLTKCASDHKASTVHLAGVCVMKQQWQVDIDHGMAFGDDVVNEVVGRKMISSAWRFLT